VVQSQWAVPDETGWWVGGHPAWLHTFVGPEATAYVIDPARGGASNATITDSQAIGTILDDDTPPGHGKKK
jgi:transposase